MANRTSKLRILFPGLFDLLLILAVFIPLTLVLRFVKPAQIGFSCDDVSIQYPYKKDTISGGLLSIIGLGVPNTVFPMVEMALAYPFRPNIKASLSVVALHIVRIQGFFLFGGWTTFAVTEAAKFGSSRLRPHFMDACRPNITEEACSKGMITDYVCTGNSTMYNVNSQKSFPSGHASFIFYAAVFTVLYLEAQLHIPRTLSRLLKTYIQVLCMIAAMFIASSRVSDHHHHLSDVIVGAVIGTIMAIWLFLRMGEYLNIKLWNNPPKQKDKEHVEEITEKREENGAFLTSQERENVC